MDEIWKEIEDTGYQISSFGRIKGLSGKIGIGRKHNRGYLRFTIGNKDRLMHRLVALTFICNPDNRKQVDHIDGDKTNNNISNLRWVSQSENTKSGHELGLWAHKIPMRRKVKSDLGVFESIASAARAVGVDPSSVSRNLLGTTNTAGGYTWEYIN